MKNFLRKFFTKKETKPSYSNRKSLRLEALEDRQLLAVTGLESGGEVVDPNVNVAGPTVSLVENYSPIKVSDAIQDTKVAKYSLSGFDYYENIVITIDGQIDTTTFDFGLVFEPEGETQIGYLFLRNDTTSTQQFNNILLSVNGVVSDVAFDFEITNPQDEINFNLAKYNTDQFIIDADANTISLNVIVNGGLRNLEKVLYNNNATVNVFGRSCAEDNVLFTNNVMTANLSQINYRGDNNDYVWRDNIAIMGTDNTDLFKIDNGLGLVSNNYNVLGTGRVQVNNGTLLSFIGTRDVFLDGAKGDDRIEVLGISAWFNAISTEGRDTFDFSNTTLINNRNDCAGVTLNLDASWRQALVAGQIGLMRLNGVFENVICSNGIDYIIGNGANNIITDNTNSFNTINLCNGGNNAVTTNGKTTVIGGEGNDNITINNGNFSVLSMTQGGNDNITVNGNNVVINTGSGNDNISFTGRTASINTNGGNDAVNAWGSYITVNSGEGDDTVTFKDLIVNNVMIRQAEHNIAHLCGGNDILYALNTSGSFNYYYGYGGNDTIIAGSGNDYLYGGLGDDILIGREGNDYIFAGAGTDLLIADRTANLDNINYTDMQAIMNDNTLTDTKKFENLVNLLGANLETAGTRNWVYRDCDINFGWVNNNDWTNLNANLGDFFG